eukprot:jgi/Ulvmu1/11728/UM008_0141.1
MFSTSSSLRGGNVITTRQTAPRVAARGKTVQVKALLGGGGDGKKGPLGGLGDMGNIMENMKKAQSMVQTEAARIQEELAATEFDGYDEEETVKMVFLGNQAPVKCELTKAAMECEQAELEGRIQEAMKDAHEKSVEGMRSKMSELAKKLGLPENMKL